MDLAQMTQAGNRKLIVLGPAMWVALVAGVVALFVGHMTAVEFTDHTVAVLSWGGGIFAGANVLEHGAKVLERIVGRTKGPAGTAQP